MLFLYAHIATIPTMMEGQAHVNVGAHPGKYPQDAAE